MLKAENLVKSFYRTEAKGKRVEFNAVDGISISVEKGEILGILGPNGAGKTTLLRMLAGLMVPTSGDVYVLDAEGNAAKDSRIVKRRIGYLSGNTKLYGRLSTRELLTMAGNLYGMDEIEINRRIAMISKLLKLDSFIDNRIEKLSTGQTQRASISRCIIHNPKLYIFDEPTLGLDIISSNSIVEFMLREKSKGKAVLYSTHYMEEAEKLCDRIIMINKGKIAAEGTVGELKELGKSNDLREVFSNLVGRGED